MNHTATAKAGVLGRFWTVQPEVWCLAVLTVGGLALRTIELNSQLWYDEIFSLVVSSRPPLRELLTIYHGEIQHPLYSLLGHLSVAVLGETAWTVRLPAVLFGTASIPLLYLLARAVATSLEGLLAAALLAFSYHHVWFSQNARGYTTLLFWTLLCTLLLYRGLEQRRWPPLLGYSVAAALGAYTHLSMVFVVVSHAVVILVLAAQAVIDRRKDRRWLAWPMAAIVLSGMLTLAFYAPIFSQVVHQFLHLSGKMNALSTPRWALLEALQGLQLGFGSQLVVMGAGLLVGCGLWGYWRVNRLAFLLLVVPVVVTVLGMAGTRGSIYPRYLFLLAGFAILIVVRGAMVLGALLARLGNPSRGVAIERAIGIGSLVLMIAVSAASLGRAYRYPKQDFSGALKFIESRRRGSEPVLTAGAAAWPYQHYYERDWPKLKDVEEVESICGQGSRVWLVYTFPRYIEDETPGLMDAIHRRFKTVWVFPGTLNDGEVFVCVKDVAESASS
jgi:4-amino-4-deoxy-L-arabinose transferase-like glycosyltransferase